MYKRQEVTIQDGVTIIGGSSFQNCTSLQKVSLPKSITSIYSSAFHGCSSLTDLILPENLQTIELFAFRNCTSLNKIVIPSSVMTLGERTFSGCTSLYTVILLSSSLSISNDSYFDDCISLTEMYIPESIYRNFIVRNILDECSNLTLFNNYNRYTTGVTVVPVSYTHLDVYKRQVPPRSHGIDPAIYPQPPASARYFLSHPGAQAHFGRHIWLYRLPGTNHADLSHCGRIFFGPRQYVCKEKMEIQRRRTRLLCVWSYGKRR